MKPLASYLLILLIGLAAHAAEVPDDLKCGPIDCDALKDSPTARFDKIDAKIKGGQKIDVDHIDELRKKFWDTYPDKPGHREARDDFAQALFEKDQLYLQANMVTGLIGGNDASAQRGAEILAQALQILSGGIDDGIPKAGQAEFDTWLYQANKDMDSAQGNDFIGAKGFREGLGFLSPTFRKASNPGGKEYQAYVMMRDWAEFDAAKVLPAAINNQQNYGLYLYCRFARRPYDESLRIYQSMCKVLGKELVETSVEQVRLAPKAEDGNLVVNVPRPVIRTPSGQEAADHSVPFPPGVIGVYKNQLVAMEVLATHDDDRRYLLYLIKGDYQNQSKQKRLDEATTKWDYAQFIYEQLKLAFGEQPVLEAAHDIRTAVKRLTTGGVMNPGAVHATREEPFDAFTETLARKDPRGYVKAAIFFLQKPDDPATLDPKKLDDAYQQFVSANGGEDAVLEAAKRMAADKPHFVSAYEISGIKSLIGAAPAPQKPAEAMIDCPEYVAWKKAKPGAKFTLAAKLLTNDPRRGPGGADQLTITLPRFTHTWTLRSIDDVGVHVWFTEQVFDSRGTPHPPRDREDGFPPKMQPPKNPQPIGAKYRNSWIQLSPEIASGEETLVIAGRSIPTKWRSTTGTDGQTNVTLTEWTNDQIPGGLVRLIEESTYPPNRGYSHSLNEVALQSIEGFDVGTPAAGDAGHQAAPAAASVPPQQPRPGGNPQPAPQAPPTPPPKPDLTAAQKAALDTAAAQRARMQRYTEIMGRAAMAQQQLNLAAPKEELPADVRDARDHLNNQIQDVVRALSKRDGGVDLESKLNTLEASAAVIEKYLAKQK